MTGKRRRFHDGAVLELLAVVMRESAKVSHGVWSLVDVLNLQEQMVRGSCTDHIANRRCRVLLFQQVYSACRHSYFGSLSVHQDHLQALYVRDSSIGSAEGITLRNLHIGVKAR